ncbi:hypothetical protein FRB98_005217 [Tulasnella sp. 332]|nr:hypothetical protein FRB98_005217 [Tulasnella sp. 332]
MPAKEPASVSKWHNAAKFRQRGIFRPAAENPLIDLLLALPKCEVPARPVRSPKKPTPQTKTPAGRKSLRARKTGASDVEAPITNATEPITKMSSQKRATVSSSPLRTKPTATLKSRISMLTEDGGGKAEESSTKGQSAPTGKKRIMPEPSEDEGQPSKLKTAPKITARRKKKPSTKKCTPSETEADDSDNMPLQLPPAKRQRLSPIAESPASSMPQKDVPPKPVARPQKRKAAESEAEADVCLPTSPAKKARTKSTKALGSRSPACAPPPKTTVKSKKPVTAETDTSAASGSKAAPTLKRWAMFDSEGDGVQELNAVKKEKTTGVVAPYQEESTVSVEGRERVVEQVESNPEGPEDQSKETIDDPPKKQIARNSGKKTATTKPPDVPKKAKTVVNEDDDGHVEDDEVEPKPKPKPKMVGQPKKSAASVKGKEKESARVPDGGQDGEDLEDDKVDELDEPPKKQPKKKVAKKTAAIRKKQAGAETLNDDDTVVVDGPAPKPKRGRGRPTTTKGRKKAPAKRKPMAKNTVEAEESAEEFAQGDFPSRPQIRETSLTEDLRSRHAEKPKPTQKKSVPKKRSKVNVADNDTKADDDKNFTDTAVALNSAPAKSRKKPPPSRGKAIKPKPKSRPPPPRKSMFARALEAELNPDSEADPLDLFS